MTPPAPPSGVWLEVTYSEKDAAKAAGARWDPEERRWYAPKGLTAELTAWAAADTQSCSPLSPAPSERIWLDVPFDEKEDAKAMGARWDPKALRWFAPRAGMQGLAPWLSDPALDPVLSCLPGEDRTFGDGLFVDMLPSSCWCSNIRSYVSPEDWGRIEALVYDRVDRCCEACGAQTGKDQGLSPVVHERWEYNELTLVQSLRRLMCLCDVCHLTTHIGYTEGHPSREECLQHLQKVNDWDVVAAYVHADVASDLCAKRSQYDWELDLSLLTGAGVTVSEPLSPEERRLTAISTYEGFRATRTPPQTSTPTRTVSRPRTKGRSVFRSITARDFTTDGAPMTASEFFTKVLRVDEEY